MVTRKSLSKCHYSPTPITPITRLLRRLLRINSSPTPINAITGINSSPTPITILGMEVLRCKTTSSFELLCRENRAMLSLSY